MENVFDFFTKQFLDLLRLWNFLTDREYFPQLLNVISGKIFVFDEIIDIFFLKTNDFINGCEESLDWGF